jgi:hypothetical protein
MPVDVHTILYASPAHIGAKTVECSCGWTIAHKPSTVAGHDAIMKDLLAAWLDHAKAAQADD